MSKLRQSSAPAAKVAAPEYLIDDVRAIVQSQPGCFPVLHVQLKALYFGTTPARNLLAGRSRPAILKCCGRFLEQLLGSDSVHVLPPGDAREVYHLLQEIEFHADDTRRVQHLVKDALTAWIRLFCRKPCQSSAPAAPKEEK